MTGALQKRADLFLAVSCEEAIRHGGQDATAFATAHFRRRTNVFTFPCSIGLFFKFVVDAIFPIEIQLGEGKRVFGQLDGNKLGFAHAIHHAPLKKSRDSGVWLKTAHEH